MHTEDNIENKKWFALYTKPRHEFKAEEQLLENSIESFLPTTTILKKWSDRKKKVTEPLFKGYIFIHANEKERLYALELKPIIKTIYFDGKPAIIPKDQIETIKLFVLNKAEIKVHNQLQVGTKVKILDGPFVNSTGEIFRDENSEKHLAVRIDSLNQAISVKVPANIVTEVINT